MFLLSTKFQIRSYRCAIVLYGSILVMGSIPGARADIGQYASGLVLHTVAYAVITLLLYLGSNGNRRERAVRSILTIMVMGAFDEYLQSFFPFRHADVVDWMVDVSAAIASSMMMWSLWPVLIDSE
jgi:VanZ family protein